MRIVWTHWKIALLRGRFHWMFLVAIVYIFALLFFERGELSGAEGDGVLGHLPFDPFLTFLPLWFLFGVPVCCHTEWQTTTGAAFSFCLPGHRESLRRLCFSCALPFGLACCLVWIGTELTISHSDQSGALFWQAVVIDVLSSFLAGIAVFLVLAASRFVLPPLVWGILALLTVPLVVLGLFVAYALCEHPCIAIPVCASVIVFFWIRLGNVQSVARGHRAIIDRTMNRQSEAGVKRTAPVWMDGLFLDRARRYPSLGQQRYVWVSLYQTFGRALSYWKWALAGAVAIAVVLAWAWASRGAAEVVFATLGFAGACVELPVNSNLPVPGGRRERYYATALAVLATSLLLVTLGLAIAGLSELIAMGLGAPMQYLGSRFSTAWLACIFVPWIGMLQLRGRAWLGITELAMVVIIGVLLLQLFSQSVSILEWFIRMRLWVYGGVCLVGWVFFLLRLRRVCTRKCLAKRSHGV